MTVSAATAEAISSRGRAARTGRMKTIGLIGGMSGSRQPPITAISMPLLPKGLVVCILRSFLSKR